MLPDSGYSMLMLPMMRLAISSMHYTIWWRLRTRRPIGGRNSAFSDSNNTLSSRCRMKQIEDWKLMWMRLLSSKTSWWHWVPKLRRVWRVIWSFGGSYRRIIQTLWNCRTLGLKYWIRLMCALIVMIHCWNWMQVIWVYWKNMPCTLTKLWMIVRHSTCWMVWLTPLRSRYLNDNQRMGLLQR